MARANVFDPDFDADMEEAGFVRRRAGVARQAGAADIGATLHVLEPGQTAHPYHFHLANEEMLVLLTGTLSLRTPDGVEDLAAGDVVAHPVGEQGAHQVTNRGQEAAHFLMVSEMNDPEVVFYPDSGKVGARGGDRRLIFREADAVDYFVDESPPEA
jgi:uncharacterized cupin superfamily protein